MVGLRNGYIGVHTMACEDTERETAVHSLTTRAYKYSEVNTPINCNVLYIYNIIQKFTKLYCHSLYKWPV